MPVNSAGAFSGDVPNYIAKKTLPLSRRRLVVFQFGDPATLPKGMGTTYTASRYVRIPLPVAPLSEGVPPQGQLMSLQQVTAQCQQWGDKITITDVAEMTIYHPLFKTGTELLALQIAETLERNTFVNLLANAQINYVNSRGSRSALVTGDVLNPHEVNRAVVMLKAAGCPRFMGDEQTNTKIEAGSGQPKASSNPRGMPHYVAVGHDYVLGDFSENQTVVTAWTYSDLNRLYNSEVGEWRGMRFCESNMVPSFVGVAAVGGTAVGGGSLAANTYYVQVTGQDVQNQYESRICQVSAGVVVGANGAIQVTTPSTVGFTYQVYVGTTTAPLNLGLSVQGPTVGPLAGQASQLPPSTVVTITGLGVFQTPPAAPATGITVWPTFIFGRGAYAQVMLDNVKFMYLKDADKLDFLNQLRIMGWKLFYGMLIKNQQFMMRIESTSAFNSTFG